MLLYPIPLDEVDALAIEFLPPCAPNIIVKRQLKNRALIVFSLESREFGFVGTVRLLKVGDGTELNYTEPQFPDSMEVAFIAATKVVLAKMDMTKVQREAYDRQLRSSPSLSQEETDDILELYKTALHIQRKTILQETFNTFLKRLQQKRSESKGLAVSTPTKKTIRDPNVRTQERYRIFNNIKTLHPTWSQAKVALEASEELSESVTAETVRNTYRLMGVKWERADRIR